ncbi:MAG TPA: CBS domain-containing protein [Kouleothrix sp.]|jgi:acetoin utilization protein AcuB|uniref:CBS domain-containing protein n=1 Tax=Kouleothrix sp. TaxID=2779161 RepID=UPI002C6D1971|nr:CBS domain-containing protein [Kouleothrix sp.]HRC77363.1 CBS domain-containing protein [Kouleothrix sp.]
MLVKDYMTRHPIMIEPGRRVLEVQKLMADNNIRHLPVVGDGKRLIGLVTRQRIAIRPEQVGSLDPWELTRYLSGLTVDKVMISGPDLATIAPDATLEQAADLMIARKISGLPVVEDNGIVVGIITETDLLIELRNLLGAIDPGWRVVMRVPDRNGEFRKLIRVISDNGWGIMALGSVRTPKDPNHWDLIVKVRHAQRDALVAALNSIEGQQLVDLRETTEEAR